MKFFWEISHVLRIYVILGLIMNLYSGASATTPYQLQVIQNVVDTFQHRYVHCRMSHYWKKTTISVWRGLPADLVRVVLVWVVGTDKSRRGST